MTNTAWSKALHHPDPRELVGMMASGDRPIEVDGLPWSHALSLRIASLQWTSDTWLHEHHDEWMQLWKEEAPSLTLGTSDGRPFVFHLLDTLEQAENRYMPGQMHLPRWLALARQFQQMGMEVAVCGQNGTSAMEYLLLHATNHPYLQIFDAWCPDPAGAFPGITSGRVIRLMDRLFAGQQKEEDHPTREKIIMGAISSCQDPELHQAVAQWCANAVATELFSGILAASQAHALQQQTSTCAIAPKGTPRL